MTIEEKIVLAGLSVLLLIGAAILYLRDIRTENDIVIAHDGIKKVYSLQEITAVIKEKNKVCINTAGEEDLARIPEVGTATARRIKAYREENGPFFSATQLLNVKGIGEKKFEKMKDMIKIQ